MIKVSLRGLAGRKLRAVLTAIAIVLGVAMISGTYILTDTIDRAFSTLFTESYAGTDAVVTGKGLDISIDGEAARALRSTRRCSRPCAASTESRSRPGAILDDTEHEDPHTRGRGRRTGGAPSFGFGIDTDPALAQFNPLNARRGPLACRGRTRSSSTPVRPTSRATRSATTSRSRRSQPKRAFELVGVAQYGSVDSLGTATFAVFTIPAAQELFDREGQFDAISAAAKDGVTEDELVAAIDPCLPAEREGRERDSGGGRAVGRDRTSSRRSSATSCSRSPASRSS